MPVITLNINWSHLIPQFEEMMQHSQYSLPEIRECLSNVHNWTESLPFYNEVFWYEGASFTLTKLANVVEMLVGDDREFVEVMRLKVIQTADKLMSEQQELNEEYEVEKEDAA